jgi:hypothetical protein
MSRCICVLGTGRSGTSATAGVLHKLGVPMGEPFVGADGNNPWGTFEDARLMTLTRWVIAGTDPVEAFKPIWQALSEQPLWGFKIPPFVKIAHQALPLLQELAEVRLVIAVRPREACIASYRRAYGVGRDQAKFWFEERYRMLGMLSLRLEVPTLYLWWPRTLREPMGAAQRLAYHAFEGMNRPGWDVIQEAAGHIRQGVRDE